MGVGLTSTEVLTLFIAGLALFFSLGSIFFELVFNFEKIVDANWRAIIYIFFGGLTAVIAVIFGLVYGGVMALPLEERGVFGLIGAFIIVTMILCIAIPTQYMNLRSTLMQRQRPPIGHSKYRTVSLCQLFLVIVLISVFSDLRLPVGLSVMLGYAITMGVEYIAFRALIAEGFRLERARRGQ